jgi:cohesin complex subunit SA-1/2
LLLLFPVPSVLNLSSRKKDFQALLSILSKSYQESADPIVIQNCCRALVYFAKSCHSRSDNAILLLNELWATISTRLLDLMKVKANKTTSTTPSDDDDSMDDENLTTPANAENSIRLCLLRLSILMKRWPILGRVSDNTNSGDDIREEISLAISSYIATELQSRQIIYPDDEDTIDPSDKFRVPEIWSTLDDSAHHVVANSVSDGLDFLLGMVAWRLKDEVQRIDDGDADDLDPSDIGNHIVLRIRTRIEKLIGLCYEQFLPADNQNFSESHQVFSVTVQEHGIRVSGDLRTLFPRKWSQAKSPFLTAVAITNDSVLAGGASRFVQSRELTLKGSEDDSIDLKQRNDELIYNLLLPLARALCANWESGSRKEACVAFMHLTGSGKEASEFVQTMARALKRMSPVRILEAQMACLRTHFEMWAESVPDEPGDRPTESEMKEFEEQELNHQELFDSLMNLAARLSSTLGVGKIRDKVLNTSILGFVVEGVRFAFSTNVSGSDEALPLGCRLPFLTVLSKYLMWIRNNRDFKNVVIIDLNAKETELCYHPEFDDVYEEDLKALSDFRKVGEFGEFRVGGNSYATRKISLQKEVSTSIKPRMSLGSSVSSIHSKASGSLDSIQEEDPSVENGENSSHEDDTSHSTPSPKKRPRTISSARTLSSAASSLGPEFADDTEGSVSGDSSSP